MDELLSRINVCVIGTRAALRLGKFAIAEQLTNDMLAANERAQQLLRTAMMQ